MKIGTYTILDEIGRGGMGAVLRARHGPTGAIRAIKLMSGSLDATSLERFRREAQALARLDGQGVVPVHEMNLQDGRPYFVMAFMPGGSLRKRLAKGALSWREAAALVAKVARTLDRCHELGLVHRDLKPDNILFDEQGEPWLADFGCVRDSSSDQLTRTGRIIGTIAYMAPEQLDGRKVDHRADLFALGVMLYELVTGALPFSGNTHVELLVRICRGDRDREERKVAPEAFSQLLDRIVAVNPLARPRSARDIARDLEAILAGTEVERPRRRIPAAVPAVAVVVLLALFLVMRRGPAAAGGSLVAEATLWTEIARARGPSSHDGLLAAQVAARLVEQLAAPDRELQGKALAALALAEQAQGSDASADDAATRALAVVEDPTLVEKLRLVRARARAGQGKLELALDDLRGKVAHAEALRAELLVALERWSDVLALEGTDGATRAAKAWATFRGSRDSERAKRELASVGSAGREGLLVLEGILATGELAALSSRVTSSADLMAAQGRVPRDIEAAVRRIVHAYREAPSSRLHDRKSALAALEGTLWVMNLAPRNLFPRSDVDKALDSERVNALADELVVASTLVAGEPTLAHRVLAAWLATRLPLSKGAHRREARRELLPALDAPALPADLELPLAELAATDFELEVFDGKRSAEDLVRVLERAAGAKLRWSLESGFMDPRWEHANEAAEICGRIAAPLPPEGRGPWLERARGLLARARALAEGHTSIRNSSSQGVRARTAFMDAAETDAFLALIENDLAGAARALEQTSTENGVAWTMLLAGELARRTGNRTVAEGLFARAVKLDEEEHANKSRWCRHDAKRALAFVRGEKLIEAKGLFLPWWK